MTYAPDLDMTLNSDSPNQHSICMNFTCAKRYAHVLAGITAIILLLIAVLKFVYISDMSGSQ